MKHKKSFISDILTLENSQRYNIHLFYLFINSQLLLCFAHEYDIFRFFFYVFFFFFNFKIKISLILKF